MTGSNKILPHTLREEAPGVWGKLNTISLLFVAAFCFVLALTYTRAVMIPLVISFFIFTMMTPIIGFFRGKLKLPKWLAVIAAGVLVFVPLGLLIMFLVNSVTNFVQVAGTYQERLIQAFNWIVAFIESLSVPLPQEALNIQTITSLISGQQVTNFLRGFGGVTLQIVSYSTLVLIFVFFFLIGSGTTNITNNVVREVQNKISAYMYIHIVASLLTGFLVWLVYISVGLELAAVFAVLTIFLNFIPNVGSIMAVLLPLPIAIIQFNFGPQFWLVLALTSVIQFLIGNIIEPKFLGDGLDLHPVTIVGSLVFWALIWGIPGAFLAVPITSTARIILSQSEPTRWFAEILAGRLPK
ncbi:MAG: AI-2E family transporter [Elusimicrobiota bacterium]|jgi:AI-2 transport protein TqsA|nr:AI-2E family transporter [Elusimicrobiota bacterium]